MRQEEAALRAFLAAKLNEAGLEADEKAIAAVVAATKLEEGEPKEENETRHVSIHEGTDGKLNAKSIKWYNLMKVSFYDLRNFLLTELAILYSDDTKAQVILSLLNLLNEFHSRLTYKFNETDARILLAIYRLNKDTFALPDLLDAYSQQFDTPLPASQAERSLNFFGSLKVLVLLKDGNYSVKEKMIYERD